MFLLKCKNVVPKRMVRSNCLASKIPNRTTFGFVKKSVNPIVLLKPSTFVPKLLFSTQKVERIILVGLF
jgi:hypothetical protein